MQKSKLGMGLLEPPCVTCKSTLGYVDLDDSIICAMCSRTIFEGDPSKYASVKRTEDVIYSLARSNHRIPLERG